MRMNLLLENGDSFPGVRFAGKQPVAGEVVFNTAMTGYVESLTDPSYRGQILVLTYPLIGNYGVPPRAKEAMGRPFESSRIQVQGLIVQHYVHHYSHREADRSLAAWLEEEGVTAITGVDTRRLTKVLREAGTMLGLVVAEDDDPLDASKVDMECEVFDLVAPSEPIYYEGSNGLTILLVDVGVKDSIVRSLLQRGAAVKRIPWHWPLAEQTSGVDGILIGNGPGDPEKLGNLVGQVRGLMATCRVPIFGICLGNQILSLAAGACTYKLPFGHRGVNQPVQDLLSRRCVITSQNHGYAVDSNSLPADWETWFVNINDGTNEGVRSRVDPFFGVQFHPEGNPGPEDTGYLFDEFLSLAGAMRRS